ncbi:YeiH family protein [Desulfospira joergensenii]|uniref:YeiH family protein n=1 Tax=Desulfospira joergensenii TaxID=53329 RepID=UPI0003B62C84|nr:putative sulfate exporter family transporter [Desulfospira joergensenii]
MAEGNSIVVDQGRWEWSEMWKKEDWWAIWIGFFILAAAMFVYFPHSGEMKKIINKAQAEYGEAANRTTAIKTIAWYKLYDGKKKAEARKISAGKWLSSFTHKTHGWTNNPMDAFFMGKEKAAAKAEAAKAKYAKKKAVEDAAYAAAVAAEELAEAQGFKNEALNAQASKAIADWRDAKLLAGKAKKKTKVSPYNQIGSLIGLGVFFCILFGIPMKIMGTSFRKFALAFVLVYAVTVLAWFFSYQTTMKHYGIGYAAWAIFLGMLISNTVGTPKWAMPAVQTEYYIKTGLVLLGAKILFEKIISIGTAGIFVAWVVTPTVWLVTYWFGQKLVKMPSKRLNAVICSDMSVCGVSAAIAAASACRAKKEELTLAVGLSLVFTAIMMIAMPAVIKASFPVDKQMILGGAWMGGTIDASGAVAAAGAFLGEKALYVAATIKMIQNVLIGVIAFFIALYFTTRVEVAETGAKVGLNEIWFRFPKFVIGFIIASLVFSMIYSGFNDRLDGLGQAMIDKGTIKGGSDLFRSWFFTLSFVSIGLATNFRELKEHFKGGKPLILYVFGQSLNLVLTLLMAYIMFYVVFPELTATI